MEAGGAHIRGGEAHHVVPEVHDIAGGGRGGVQGGGETHLNYIKFKVKETGGQDIVIATTRPELLAATVAVIFNPGDDRYKPLNGLHAIVPPIFGQEVPILPHPAAKPDFGSGLVMISTFGDTRDLSIVNDLRLPPMKIVVTQDGRMGGRYREVRGHERGEGQGGDREGPGGRGPPGEEGAHSPLRTGLLEVRHPPIEVIVTKELFLRQLAFKEELLRIIREKMRFHPPEYAQTLINWVSSLQFDWPISRRRYYGTEIPIWYCVEDGKVTPHPTPAAAGTTGRGGMRLRRRSRSSAGGEVGGGGGEDT